jgi:hypothetical protein
VLNTKDYRSGGEKMNEEGNFKGSNRNPSGYKTDRFRGNCEKNPSRFSGSSQDRLPETETPTPQVYVRKYSVLQRLYKLIVSPSEAMKDIGLAPDYSGPMLLVILETIFGSVALALVFQKIQLIGDSQTVSRVWGLVSTVVAIAVVLSIFLFIAFWLVKSLLVKYLCDGGSGWSFGTAASVTGYAYLPDVIFGIISLIVVYPLLPSLTLNVSDLTAASQALADFRAQALGIELALSIPIGLIGIIWKSYLGGLGAKFGTQEQCKLMWAFVAFFVLALLGWLISFLLRGTV